MRNFIYLIGIISLLVACGSKEDELANIQKRAGTTAQMYYKYLLDGKYEDFIDGMNGADSLPLAYREQMIANTAMFVKQQTDEHQGIKDVVVSRCVADTATHTADAILNFKYGDNTQETVCVPLVEHDGNWYMK